MPKPYRLEIPARRYALFENIFGQQYMVVLKGQDMETAPRWGGFVKWVGAVRPAETRGA